MGRIAALTVLAWDHNSYYHRLLMRQLPAGCARVLDVGCGAGGLAVELAGRVQHVDAVDRSPAMIEAARRAAPANVRCVLADVLTDPLPADGYDAIVSIAALHHMPVDDALRRLSAALRPGGVLAVVALPRRDLVREWPAELAAAVGHRILGVAFVILRRRAGSWYGLAPEHGVMPVVLDPPLTTRQVRRRAAAVLPGAKVRRLVFWRYLLTWRRQ